MSTYIKNISELSLPNCAKRDGRGFRDLAPGESGILGPPADAAIIKIWLEKNRIKLMTEEEYAVDQVAAATPTATTPQGAAAKAITLEDGSAAINPGYDSIPEAEEIPEPIVSNIDKTGKVIAMQAPPDAKPMASEKGDPITMKASDFAPKILKDDGRVIDTAKGPTKAQELAGVIAPPVKPVETKPTAPEAQAVPVSAEARATEIASMKAWRQQDKALRTATAEVIALVKTKTKFDVVTKLCDELIAKKST
jgi:hypothetical protein